MGLYFPKPNYKPAYDFGRTPSWFQIRPILRKPYVDVNSTYTLEKELGRSRFEVIYLCTKKAAGKIQLQVDIAAEAVDDQGHRRREEGEKWRFFIKVGVAAIALSLMVVAMKSDGRELRPSDHGLVYQEPAPASVKSPADEKSFFGGGGEEITWMTCCWWRAWFVGLRVSLCSWPPLLFTS